MDTMDAVQCTSAETDNADRKFTFLDEDSCVSTDTDVFEVSRKDKSLSLLCQSFLLHVSNEAKLGNDIHMETVATKLGVEKRRVYDIVNVMEALDAMSRSHKSFYRWHGLAHLPRLMHDLKTEAEADGLPSWVETVERAMCNFSQPNRAKHEDKENQLAAQSQNDSGYFGSQESLNSQCSTESANDGVAADAPLTQTQQLKSRNTLCYLCRRFLMVLLANGAKGSRVSLDVASTILIKDPKLEGFEPPSRSRCRRLYDIANVLVALGLIRKMHYMFGTKKIPLFAYCGPQPDVNGCMVSDELSVLLPDLGKVYNPPAMKPSPNVPSKCSSFVPFHLNTTSVRNNTITHNADQPLDLSSTASKPKSVGSKKANRKATISNNENIPPIAVPNCSQVLHPLAIKLSALRTPLASLGNTNQQQPSPSLGLQCHELSAFKPIRPNNTTSVGTSAYPYSWLMAHAQGNQGSSVGDKRPNQDRHEHAKKSRLSVLAPSSLVNRMGSSGQ